MSGPMWRSVVAGLMLIGAARGVLADEYAAQEYRPPEYAPRAPLIEIWKAKRRMELRQGDQVLREFKISLGWAPSHAKELRGDNRTPVGRYYITGKRPSRYHFFLGLSYPNVEDAERGYQHGLIDAQQWADIYFANLRGDPPTAQTALGGMVGIHGFGGRPYLPIDWTEGCIAVSNDDAEYLYQVVSVGTPVIINP
ncbi:MAG: L,D-transpeptidase [Deltaproteobacteria bacterium]|nr:L,D-transpeptidase [Deltaproteobacteria bacterium]